MLSRLGFCQRLLFKKTRMTMKKIMLIAGAAAALILAGCDKGGTSDQYGTSNGNGASSNSLNNAHSDATGSNSPVNP